VRIDGLDQWASAIRSDAGGRGRNCETGEEHEMKCVYCRKAISAAANVCPYCQRETGESLLNNAILIVCIIVGIGIGGLIGGTVGSFLGAFAGGISGVILMAKTKLGMFSKDPGNKVNLVGSQPIGSFQSRSPNPQTDHAPLTTPPAQDGASPVPPKTDNEHGLRIPPSRWPLSFIVFLILSTLACIFEASRILKTPIITVAEPQNSCSIKARTIAIKGTVSPANATVLISGDPVIPDKNGYFVAQIQLPHEGDNWITVWATHGYKEVTTYLTIIRILTDDERAAVVKAAAENDAADARAMAAETAANAKAKAEEAAYPKTQAGQLCAKHPSWTRYDCQNVATHRIWIGMTLEMLKAIRGRPDQANPSNYGNGTSWQWCWSDHAPSCFYGGDDGITTSYN
jgi:hypothetical protein